MNDDNTDHLKKLSRLVPLANIALIGLLRAIVLRDSLYHDVSKLTLQPLVHLIFAAVLDQALLIASVAFFWINLPKEIKSQLREQERAERWGGTNAKNSMWHMKVKIYLALACPELLRVFAIMLQIFDDEPSLLFLTGLLTVSLQLLALQCLLTPSLASIQQQKQQQQHENQHQKHAHRILLMGMLGTTTIKTLIKYYLYRSSADIWRMGIIL
mmetsp:Transcript_25730/g.42932  ORF Transcript_25730/g.42932 Transcript_25730/m.42932 type:complete len:213 (+) Transcript_25730:407-1045(+)